MRLELIDIELRNDDRLYLYRSTIAGDDGTRGCDELSSIDISS